MTVNSIPDAVLLEEAADWAMAFRYDGPDPARQGAFDRWHGQSSAHAKAWAQAQGVFQALEAVPPELGKRVLAGPAPGLSRRAALRRLAMAALAAPAGVWAWREQPWRDWLNDFSTNVGERLAVSLPDASDLVLNTQSAVKVAFDASTRRLRLVEGEILITTHADPAARPFVVDTSAGTVQALGTRFALRALDGGEIRVSVFEHAVRIRSLQGEERILNAGEEAVFDTGMIQDTAPVADSADLWQHGMLLAQDMRLGDVVAELARYRRGVLRCDPAVADQRLSGAISLTDTDSALDLIAQTLPVEVVRRTPLWVTVTPRG